jgi:hypothetical protein
VRYTAHFNLRLLPAFTEEKQPVACYCDRFSLYLAGRHVCPKHQLPKGPRRSCSFRPSSYVDPCRILLTRAPFAMLPDAAGHCAGRSLSRSARRPLLRWSQACDLLPCYTVRHPFESSSITVLDRRLDGTVTLLSQISFLVGIPIKLRVSSEPLPFSLTLPGNRDITVTVASQPPGLQISL